MMRVMCVAAVTLTAIGACGGGSTPAEHADAAVDAPRPRCGDVIPHFYVFGCWYYDDTATTKLTVAEAVQFCETIVARTPMKCSAELDAWLACNASNTVGQPECCGEASADLWNCAQFH